MQVEARLVELDAQLTDIAQTEPYREPVGWLRCFRGIDTLTAILILAELHDFRRSHAPRALMAYLGLVPGEDSTGEKYRRGRITRAGNALVRRLLVETAWHYRRRPGIGIALTRRRTGQPTRVIAIADKAQQRLCRRFRRLGLTVHQQPDRRGRSVELAINDHQPLWNHSEASGYAPFAYFVSPPSTAGREPAPSAAYTLPSRSTATPSPATPMGFSSKLCGGMNAVTRSSDA